MKKALVLTLCCSMVFALCACSGSSSSESEASTETADETTDETEDTQVYAFQYDALSMVDLGNYENLTYTIEDTSVSEDDIQAYIDELLQNNAVAEQLTDRAVEDGDTINLDYVGKIDGEEFDGGTATGATLTIGSGSYIDGFEDQLIGAMPGEEVTVDVTFPDPYENNEDLSGKDAEFTCTVNYIVGDDVVPEYTDEFVSGLGIDGVTTTDEYHDYAEGILQEENEEQAESDKQDELFQQIVADSTVNEYPEELVSQYEESYRTYYEEYASYFGMELADFLEQYMGTTEDAFNEDAAEYGKQATASVLIMTAIAQKEGYEVTDDIYQAKLVEYAEENGYDDADALAAAYSENYIKQAIISERVMEIIESTAQGVEAEETEAAETEAE